VADTLPRRLARAAKARTKAQASKRAKRPEWVRPSASPPPVGGVRMGHLRRLTPISTQYGFDRGLPVDRYYVEDFLRRHGSAPGYATGDIRGRVLEIGGDDYMRQFGGWGEQGSAVEQADVFHFGEANEDATIVGDLTDAGHVPSDTFDCILCTQTLHVIYDFRAALATLHRILKPGGVLLATFPGISQACVPDKDLWGDWWRFTGRSARRVFEEVFPAEQVTVDSYGNVLASVAFLEGIAAHELRRDELDPRDPNYELLLAVRAVK
jgi:SAM-dependent methyltransferase